ncbi:methyltransferase family protein [Pseudobutyrivibrio xylanivorans]|uniref:Protein-S-isoprenylcysteine O-methyltransferase Ste14 n=1 Tax=Pseudobutyrivibrio xylanivorans DSM 14809 TaxID=1123012 RepID=A0A1M6GD29_PSEXY|nr:isoprenylcysteine carboxylmethyltransferase family protein [Pseudobutyrivibrio xylanivorans]SHJ07829.1 Protein-S-isoprenylcysteine O-methyltransferase Ste14 [Pseudobutyrivibrio xylanivorans DSM 14809]
MSKELFIQAIIKFVAGIVILGVLLFIPAGTFHYWNGWLFMAVLFIPMFVAGIIMMFKNQELLKKRLNAKEEQAEQKHVVIFSGIMFISAFVVAGLNFRFQWIVLPKWAIVVATGIFLVAYLLYAEVIRENEFLSRTVEVQENQKVVDTGLYGIVRHPMYSVTLLLFGAMPWVLGSPISFIIMLVYIPIITKRIINEEQVLKEGLEGYSDYCEKIRYRIIPFIY